MSLWLLVTVMTVAAVAGVLAERRWHAGAVQASGVGMGWMLRWVLPPVYLVLVSRLHVDLRLVGGLAAAYFVISLLGLLAWFIAARVLRLPRRTVGAVILAVILGNTGYFGLPLAQAVLGPDELGSAVAWDSLVSGPMFYVVAFAVGAAFATGGAGSVHAGEVEAESRLGAFLRNPLLWASVAGLVLPFDAPDWSASIAHVAVLAMLPAGFLVVGIRLSAESGHADEGETADGAERKRGRGWLSPELATIVTLRLVVGPLLIVGLSVVALDLPPGMLLQAAAPTGLNGLLVAHRFGLDQRPIAAAIVVTTVAVTAGAIVVSLVG